MAIHVERAGAGPDLVLLHGWCLHGGVWDALAQRLAASFRLHVVDLPGHGRSRDVAFGALDDVVDEVAACCPEGAGVCGWSLGGLVALRLATRHPARVGALALVSATPRFARAPGWPHGMAPATLAAFADGLGAAPGKTIRRFLDLCAHGGPDARRGSRELAAILAQRETPSAADLASGLALLAHADLRSEVPAIGVPAIVVHGERDALVPVAAARWLAASLPAARLTEIAGAAHVPFATHPDAVALALADLHG